MKDPHEVVKTGDIVNVKVMEVDVARKRIALSMRTDDEVAPTGSTKNPEGKPDGRADHRKNGGPKPAHKNVKPQNRSQAPKPQAKGSMAALFEKALKKP